MEAIALAVGWMLGGSVGIGTVLLVLFSGPVMQACFRIMRFDATEKPNESLIETLSFLRNSHKVAG